MNILVTGAKGFVGRNLCENLKNLRDGKNRTRPNLRIEEIYEYDIDSTAEELDGLPEEQRLVLRALATDTPKLSDQLAEETGLPIQRVLPALTLLEISGWAAQNGARSFVRTVALPEE